MGCSLCLSLQVQIYQREKLFPMALVYMLHPMRPLAVLCDGYVGTWSLPKFWPYRES